MSRRPERRDAVYGAACIFLGFSVADLTYGHGLPAIILGVFSLACFVLTGVFFS